MFSGTGGSLDRYRVSGAFREYRSRPRVTA